MLKQALKILNRNIRSNHSTNTMLHIIRQVLFWAGNQGNHKNQVTLANGYTLESGIDIGQGIAIGPGEFVKKNKRRALNKHRA